MTSSDLLRIRDEAKTAVDKAYVLGRADAGRELQTALQDFVSKITYCGVMPEIAPVLQEFLARVNPLLPSLHLSDDDSEPMADAAQQRVSVTPFETGAPWRGAAEAEWDATREG